MATNRFTIARVCTLSRGTRAVRLRHAVRQIALTAAALLLVATPRAHANPIGIQFSSTLDYGSLAGTPVWGSFFWDDAGPSLLTAPMTALTMNIGSRQYNLSHGAYPAFVQAPHLDPNFGFANNWGPNFQLRSNVLFGGLTNFSLFEGGSVFVAYSYLPSASLQYLTQANLAPATMTVPEPGSLVLGLGALAGAWLARRRVARRTAGPGKRPGISAV